MTPEEATKLKSGDRVFWNDPDEGACSRWVTVVRIEVDDEECRIDTFNPDNALECMTHELDRVEPCGATGWCERCEGNGLHYHETMEAAECEVCHGTGDCPCQFHMESHRNPCVEVMDHDEYRDMKRRQHDPRFR